jgi:hypothetical protein
LLSGSIIKHTFYCGKSKDTVAALSANSYPVFSDQSLYRDILNSIQSGNYGLGFAINHNNTNLTFPITLVTDTAFNLMNGKHHFGYIATRTCKKARATGEKCEQIKKQISDIFNLLIENDLLYLSAYPVDRNANQ